jgi:hypothetical protein
VTLRDDLWTAGYGIATASTAGYAGGRRRAQPAVFVAALIIVADWLLNLAMWNVRPHWMVCAAVEFSLSVIFMMLWVRTHVWWALSLGLLFCLSVCIQAFFQSGDLSTRAANWNYDVAVNVVFLGCLMTIAIAARARQ